MLETLLGGLLGGAFRLAPEALKWLDRKGERSHELAMQDKALEFEKLRGASKMDEIGASGDAAWNSGALEALQTAIRAQAEKSGVPWADALSSSVRPIITYSFMLLYAAVKIAIIALALQAGSDWPAAVKLAWNDNDMALFGGIINFFFLNRIFDKALR
ncbi:hypothetical protein ACFQNF_19470 [Iodobacter arcticus]|uniref:Holin of 3TMs, for gene-transfer release n=1 Tax=Iodobacter arcticus TaxID=590593 RepID=A0ABW2R293_9NEIS